MKRHRLSLVLILFVVVVIFLPVTIPAVTITPDAVVLGSTCSVEGNNSMALGFQSRAGNFHSLAAGFTAIANGYASTALGTQTTAEGHSSIAMGYNTKATENSSIVIGSGYAALPVTYLINSSPRSFMVGFMSSPTDTAPELFVKDGVVGLGTDTPTEILDIKAEAPTARVTGDNGETSSLQLCEYTNNKYYGFEFQYDGDTDKLYLWSRTFSDNEAIRMTFQKDGNVGIGTDNPQYDLDVDGDIRATGSVYYGGSSGSHNGTAYTKPDYVFEDGYQILSTDQVAKHLEREKSLPWITSLKKEKKENGQMVDMTRMSFETVETVENLQVQIIAQANIIKELQRQMKEQQRQIGYLLEQAKN